VGKGVSRPKPLNRNGSQVLEHGHPVWRLRVVGRLGKQVERKFIGTYEDAVIELENLRVITQASATAAEIKPVTLIDGCVAWLENHKWQVAPSKTQAGIMRKSSGLSKHKNILSAYVVPVLGKDMKLRRIEPSDLVAVVADATRSDGKPCAATTKQTIATTVRIMFRWLKSQNFIEMNPAENLPTNWGQALRVRESIPTLPEVKAAAEALDAAHPLLNLGDAYLLMAYTGLRYSEMVGLKTTLVFPFGNPRVIIKETVVSSGGKKQTYLSTKTLAGERVVPLTAQVIPVVRRLLASSAAAKSDFLVSGVRGGSLSVSLWGRALRKAREDNPGLTIYSAHYLRHIFCSVAISSGATDMEVMRLAGHANISVTRGTYGHLLNLDQADLASKLGAVFSTLESG